MKKRKIFNIHIVVLLAAVFLNIACSSKPEAENESSLDGAISFSCESGFYDKDIEVELHSTDKNDIIHYTMDGAAPTVDDSIYEKEIELKCLSEDYPAGYCIRAIVEHEDGAVSEVYSKYYLCGKNIKERFTTPVLCIASDNDGLYGYENGILVGDNAYLRGKDAERQSFSIMFDCEGKVIFSQNCGIRVYGGASREHFVKSLKLYARKEYDEQNKFFHFNDFNTLQKDSETCIDNYKRLVIRNTGNDYNFAYIRDEFLQTVARGAGYEDTEGVEPAVMYINGNYNGLLWLHETYCDELFKQKYGEPVKGEFVVIEGDEFIKTDGDLAEAVESFNDMYAKMQELDFCDEDSYALLCDFIDVTNYLDYYAFNLYFCNFDWPHNNVKCYRFYPEETASSDLSNPPFDGKWRFLLHDMDWSLGWDEYSKASYDNFGQFFETDKNYGKSLFSKLMKRPDCRLYLKEKLLSLSELEIDGLTVLDKYTEMDALRAKEQGYYQKWLEDNEVYDEGDWGPDYDHYLASNSNIVEFIAARPEYVRLFISTYLDE